MELSKNINLNKQLTSLINELKNDREALLQLLLSLSNKQILNRIINCPTYPIIRRTSDLAPRLDLFYSCVENDTYSIPFVLANLFQSASDIKIRKNLGQFFTPKHIAQTVITKSFISEGDSVIEPGCGTGIFPIIIIEEHALKTEFLNSISYLGVENDPLLALATAISLDWVNAPNSFKIIYENFLRINKITLEKSGYLNINIVISNPPYVRFHRLNDKKKITADLKIGGFSGLHSYFIAHVAQLIDNGRMIFITPTEMSNTHYGKDLIGQLEKKYDIKNEIIYHDDVNNIWVIEDRDKIRYSTLMKLKTVWNLMSINSKTIKLKERKKIHTKITSQKNAVELGLIANIKRGISTGSNKYFVLNDNKIQEYSLPDFFLKRIIPTKIRRTQLSLSFTNQQWNHFRNEGKPCWLLAIPRSYKKEDLPLEIIQYLNLGERAGIHLTPTSLKRKPWYSVRIVKPPDLFFTYMSRDYPKFIYNKARVLNLTNLLGVYFNTSIILPKEKINEFIRMLNYEFINWVDSESVGRKYKGGLVKFEPGDLYNFKISEEKLMEYSMLPLDPFLN